MFKKSKKNNNEVVVLSVDQNDEPVEIQKANPTFSGTGGYQIQWAPGVPDPSVDPDGFKSYLEAWHRKHNPQLFENEEG